MLHPTDPLMLALLLSAACAVRTVAVRVPEPQPDTIAPSVVATPGVVLWGSEESRRIADSLVSSGVIRDRGELVDLATDAGYVHDLDGTPRTILFPRLSSETTATVGPALARAIERQLAYLLTPRDLPFAQAIGGEDTSHFHVAVPAAQAPALAAAWGPLKEAATPVEGQFLALLAGARGGPESAVGPAVRFAERAIASGTPLEGALRSFFAAVCTIEGATLVYHTREDDGHLTNSPLRHHQFLLLADTELEWPQDKDGLIRSRVPPGYVVMGEDDIYFWPTGTLASTARLNNQRLVVSPAVASAPATPF